MLENLNVGDVILLGEQYSIKHLFSKKALQYLYEKAIVYYQRDRFGNVPHTDATHTLIYVGGDMFFEVTAPVARLTGYLSLVKHIEETKRTVAVMRYQRYHWSDGDIFVLGKIVTPMLGQPYAYVDILPFILEKVIGFLPNTYKMITSVFGDGWKKYMYKLLAGMNDIFVCSSGVAAIYVAMHKQNPDFLRPFATSDGNNEFIEMVTPAHFGCWPGDFTQVP
jgi:hypothetical protein